MSVMLSSLFYGGRVAMVSVWRDGTSGDGGVDCPPRILVERSIEVVDSFEMLRYS